MILRHAGPFSNGYTPITKIARPGVGGPGGGMDMDFGILRMAVGKTVRDSDRKERAFLLLGGSALIGWEDQERRVERTSLLDGLPFTLHVPGSVEVRIISLSENAEFAVHKAVNPRSFPGRLIRPEEVEVVVLAPCRLGGTADREIRTILDDARDPHSNMALGEIVNYPGKWSSFPPHRHPQWDLYHFRFFPENGFGYSEQGDEVFKVRNGYTALIPPGATHPQVAAPGYAMVYVWAIRHLEGDRFGSNSRIYVPEHVWTIG